MKKLLIVFCLVASMCSAITQQRWVNLKGNPVVDVKKYGATGDGSTDDSTAIYNAVTAAPTGSTVFFGGAENTYILDREIVISKKLKLLGSGAAIKLKNNSALFNDYTNLYERTLIRITADDVEVDGLSFVGNSINNSVSYGGVTRFLVSTTGAVYYVCGVSVGVFGATSPTAHVSNVKIKNCSFSDFPGDALNCAMNGATYFVRNLQVSNCYFEKGQGVQLPLKRAYNALVTGCTFRNSYFASYQIYNGCNSCTFTGNNVYFNTGEIELSLVDPVLNLNASGTALNFTGQIRFGRTADQPSYSCSLVGNNIFGAMIEMTGDIYSSSIIGNTIRSGEEVGIVYSASGTGNLISCNNISNCEDAGIYYDTYGHVPVYITDNVLIGNNNSVNAFGGRQLQCQLAIIKDHGVFRRNTIKKASAVNIYGIRIFPDSIYPPTLANTIIEDNDIKDSGHVSDFYNPDYTSNFLGAGLAEHSFALSFIESQQIELPNLSGLIAIQCASQAALMSFDADNDIMTALSATPNATNVDLPGNLCLYMDASGTPVFRQNLGLGTQAIRLKFWQW